MKSKNSLHLFLLFALPVCASGQLFPFDKVSNDSMMLSDKIHFIHFDGHIPFFGTDSFTLEIYFDPTIEVPAPGGWAFRVKCVETLFLEKKGLQGQFLWPISQLGNYQFISYRDGCYVDQFIEILPNGHGTSKWTEVWGKCHSWQKESRL